MAQIEVNHKILRDVASAITTYCAVQDREMRLADSEVKSMLASHWSGLDAQAFGGKWEGVDENDSTAVKFRELLKNFGENLIACADEYEQAQADTYNDASRLL